MTGTELLNLALPLMYSTSATEYQASAVPIINLLLEDCLNIQNSYLAAKNESELLEAPTISALSETLPYENVINRKVLPYGLAGYLYGEDDAAVATQRMNKYEYEKANNYKANYVLIEDLTEDSEVD